MTAVRKIVCRKALSSTTAFDAEGLLQSVREEDGLISLSTVYRTLSALQDAGLITEIEGIDRKKQFSVVGANTSSTSHVVCKDCGKVIPLENPCLSLRESRTAHQTGFSPKKMSLRIEATCDELHQCGSCTRA
ncbi:MAG: Fur family transcriptional regulator, partial [Puniceicoccales bacterium]